MSRFYALVLWVSFLIVCVTAIPTFEHLTGWDDEMGSLVPGAAYISVIGRADAGLPKTRYLNVHDEGDNFSFSSHPTMTTPCRNAWKPHSSYGRAPTRVVLYPAGPIVPGHQLDRDLSCQYQKYDWHL